MAYSKDAVYVKCPTCSYRAHRNYTEERGFGLCPKDHTPLKRADPPYHEKRRRAAEEDFRRMREAGLRV